MTWENIRVHDAPVEMFRRALQRNRLCHSYLFAGAPGIGKKLFALTLARTLLCQQSEPTDLSACEECAACRQVLAGTHPDLYLVSCPEGKSELTIDLFLGKDERRGQEGLCYELSLRPMVADRKIAIIDDAHLLNEPSSNALLKTLEEPPDRSLLILVTANTDAVLPTIRSRCQMIRFSPLPNQVVAELLLSNELASDPSEAASIADASDGSLAIASQMLDPELRQLRKTLYSDLSADPIQPIDVVSQMLNGLEEIGGDSNAQRQNAGWIVKFSIDFFRLALLKLAGRPIPQNSRAVEHFVERLQQDQITRIDCVTAMLERAIDAEEQLVRRVAVPLCFETLFTEIARLRRSAAGQQNSSALRNS